MSQVTVSSKGQVVIPAEIRKRLGIGPGSELELVVEEDTIRVHVVRAVSSSRLDDGYGMLRYQGEARRLGEFDVALAMRAGKAER